MEKLKQVILESENDLERKIIRVDGFINGQVNISLMDDIATEFYEHFKDKNIDKVVTVESGGIAPATLVAQKLGVDLLVLKKGSSLIMDDVFKSNIKSFTKNTEFNVTVNKKNVFEGQNYLLIDDFLAYGEVVKGVIDILKQANAHLVGAGFIVEKGYLNTSHIFTENNIEKHSIVIVKEIDTQIHFA